MPASDPRAPDTGKEFRALHRPPRLGLCPACFLRQRVPRAGSCRARALGHARAHRVLPGRRGCTRARLPLRGLARPRRAPRGLRRGIQARARRARLRGARPGGAHRLAALLQPPRARARAHAPARGTARGDRAAAALRCARVHAGRGAARHRPARGRGRRGRTRRAQDGGRRSAQAGARTGQEPEEERRQPRRRRARSVARRARGLVPLPRRLRSGLRLVGQEAHGGAATRARGLREIPARGGRRPEGRRCWRNCASR